MMKTLKKIFKLDKEKFKVPKAVQDIWHNQQRVAYSE